jgi:hypothetical protein
VVVCGVSREDWPRTVGVRSLERINARIEVRGMIGKVRDDDKSQTGANREENHDNNKLLK